MTQTPDVVLYQAQRVVSQRRRVEDVVDQVAQPLPRHLRYSIIYIYIYIYIYFNTIYIYIYNKILMYVKMQRSNHAHLHGLEPVLDLGRDLPAAAGGGGVNCRIN